MKTLATLISTTLIMLFGCASSPEPRTKHTDKSLRIMIDPDSINPGNYVRIQSALTATGQVVVIDRSMGYRAARKEQQRNYTERFNDLEKWSHWGELYGVGSIVVGHIQCTNVHRWWHNWVYQQCLQFLSVIDSSTGQVLAAIEHETDLPLDYSVAPPWDEAVEALLDTYPKVFEFSQDSPRLDYYRDLSKEKAIRVEGKPIGGTQ